MSNAGAISAVTELLSEILNNNILKDGLSFEIYTTSPDKITSINSGQCILNLYLYRITFNQGWHNHNYPSRDSAGQRIGSPILALNLHYLLTSFGSGGKNEFEEQKLMGKAMQVFHEMPVIPRSLIEQSTKPYVQSSGLADQTENIRITPEQLSTEESFRIWSSLQTNYRLSVGYQVTVVLIESTKSVRTALPVSGTTPPDHLGRQIRVVPYRQPTVDSISNSDGDGEPIIAGSSLLISGRNLIAEDVRVMSGLNVINVDTISDNMIKTSPLPTLTAGVLPLQVIHCVDDEMDSASNVKPFVLHPVISSPTVPISPTVSNVTGSATKEGKIEINVKPEIGRRQQVKLYLNKIELTKGEEALGYTLYPPADNGITASASSTGKVVFDFKNIVAGTYLVRLQVDGAESPLVFDTNDGYYEPKVEI
jgi:hypothetical protein